MRRFEINDRNNLFKKIINKYQCSVRIVEAYLTEDEAFDLECERISELKSIGQARANFHVGGRGGNTWIYRSKEENEISWKKISMKQKGKKYPPEINKKKASQKFGSKNGMFGKKKTEQEKKAQSEKMSGKNNPMYGKSIQDVWIEKYGEEEAKLREQQRRESISKGTSGKNNPMYGKFKNKNLNYDIILSIFKDVLKTENFDVVKKKYKNIDDKTLINISKLYIGYYETKEYLKNNKEDKNVRKYLIMKGFIENEELIETDLEDIKNLLSWKFKIRDINKYYNNISYSKLKEIKKSLKEKESTSHENI